MIKKYLLGLVMAVLVAVMIAAQDRPSNEWFIYYITPDGDRQAKLVEKYSLRQALDKFESENPDVFVTCAAHAYYNYCQERVVEADPEKQ